MGASMSETKSAEQLFASFGKNRSETSPPSESSANSASGVMGIFECRIERVCHFCNRNTVMPHSAVIQRCRDQSESPGCRSERVVSEVAMLRQWTFDGSIDERDEVRRTAVCIFWEESE